MMTDNIAMARKAIRIIHDLWNVDPERVQWVNDISDTEAFASALLLEAYGFDCWPGSFKVQVRISGPHLDLPLPILRLSVRTDFLRNVDVTAADFARKLCQLNSVISTFAVCAPPAETIRALASDAELSLLGLNLKSSPLWFESVAYVGEESLGWLPQLFGELAALQPMEAELRADQALLWFGGAEDRSAPPNGKLPASIDGLLRVERSCLDAGKEQSSWIGTGEFQEIISRRERDKSGFGEADDHGLRLAMSFGASLARVLLRADLSHPILGAGLIGKLYLPYQTPNAGTLAVGLNHLEGAGWSKRAPSFIGSWSVDEHDDKSGSRIFLPTFNFFIPNKLYARGVAEQFVQFSMARARSFREKWLPDDIDLPVSEIQARRQKPEKFARRTGGARSWLRHILGIDTSSQS
jgi:hypothetical protein